MDNPGKYARVERERRFLLAATPPEVTAAKARRITDRYLQDTRLRLRRVEQLDGSAPELKLTQKIPSEIAGPVQGLITNIYLSQSEYDVFAVLPAAVLRKTRYSLPPWGIDVFDGSLRGLVLAEIEFGTDDEMHAFPPPSAAVAEVTEDRRFTGGSLVRAGRDELLAWLAEFGIAPEQPPAGPLMGNS
jgi:CYTH domain-containing protein